MRTWCGHQARRSLRVLCRQGKHRRHHNVSRLLSHIQHQLAAVVTSVDHTLDFEGCPQPWCSGGRLRYQNQTQRCCALGRRDLAVAASS